MKNQAISYLNKYMTHGHVFPTSEKAGYTEKCFIILHGNPWAD